LMPAMDRPAIPVSSIPLALPRRPPHCTVLYCITRLRSSPLRSPSGTCRAAGRFPSPPPLPFHHYLVVRQRYAAPLSHASDTPHDCARASTRTPTASRVLYILCTSVYVAVGLRLLWLLLYIDHKIGWDERCQKMRTAIVDVMWRACHCAMEGWIAIRLCFAGASHSPDPGQRSSPRHAPGK
jgi:hypothetical protein